MVTQKEAIFKEAKNGYSEKVRWTQVNITKRNFCKIVNFWKFWGLIFVHFREFLITDFCNKLPQEMQGQFNSKTQIKGTLSLFSFLAFSHSKSIQSWIFLINYFFDHFLEVSGRDLEKIEESRKLFHRERGEIWGQGGPKAVYMCQQKNNFTTFMNFERFEKELLKSLQ